MSFAAARFRAAHTGVPAASGRRPALVSRRHVDFGRTASAICRF